MLRLLDGGEVLVSLLEVRIDSVCVPLNRSIVDKVNSRLTRNLNWSRHLLLLLLQLKRVEVLRAHRALMLVVRSSLVVAVTVTMQTHGLCGRGDVRKLLLQLLLALGKKHAVHLHLLENTGIHLFLLVDRWRREDLFGKGVHLARRVHGVLTGQVESSAGSTVRDGLAADMTSISLICPLGRGDVGGGMLGLVVRSGSRDYWSLRLSAQTCKQVRAARARSRVVDRVLIDGSDLGGKGDAQPFGVEAWATSSKARTRETDGVGGEAVAGGVVIVVSHLSKTASANAHVVQVVGS